MVRVRNVWYAATMLMCRRRFRAYAMADFKRFRPQAVTNIDVPSTVALTNHWITTFLQSLEGHETNTAILITKVWPDNIVENMPFDGIDR